MVSATHPKYYSYQKYNHPIIPYWCPRSLPMTHIYSPHRYTSLMYGVGTKWFIYVPSIYFTYWPYIYQSPMVILVYIMSKRKGQILRVKREQSIKYRTELTLVVTLFCMYMSIHEI